MLKIAKYVLYEDLLSCLNAKSQTERRKIPWTTTMIIHIELKVKMGTERYYVSFVNTNKELTETEVPQDTFLALQEFNRKRESISRSDRRHIERSEQTEISLNVKSIAKQLSIDETTIRNIRNSDLHQAISKLTLIQQRRVRMYFFEGQKLREISVYENCSPQAVHKSIKRGLIKLQGILSKID